MTPDNVAQSSTEVLGVFFAEMILFCCRYFFSKDGSPTVLAKQGGVQIGQRKHLSQLDKQRLNKLYHCGIHLFTSLLFYRLQQQNNYSTYSKLGWQFNNNTEIYFFFQMSG